MSLCEKVERGGQLALWAERLHSDYALNQPDAALARSSSHDFTWIMLGLSLSSAAVAQARSPAFRAPSATSSVSCYPSTDHLVRNFSAVHSGSSFNTTAAAFFASSGWFR